MMVNILLMADAYFLNVRVLRTIISKIYDYREYIAKVVYFILVATFVFILINWITRHRLIDLSDIPFDSKRKEGFSQLPYLYRFIMEFVPLTFSLAPFVLFSLLYLWIRNIFKSSKQNLLIFLISSFILIFYVAVIQQGLLLTIRYSIVLFPLVSILAAISFREFFSTENIKEKWNKYSLLVFSFITAAIGLFLYPLSEIEQNKLISERELRVFYNFHIILFFLIIVVAVGAITYLVYKLLSWHKMRSIGYSWVSGIILAASLISLFLIAPYYFSYTNELLPKKYIITSGWGYGGYESAQFMNEQPNAKDITVWTDSYGFCEFFIGRCIHKINVRTDKYAVDYLYSTLQNQLRVSYLNGPKYKQSGDPIWQLEIDGRYKNYVRLYKTQKVE
jgi:hypothetical protein